MLAVVLIRSEFRTGPEGRALGQRGRTASFRIWTGLGQHAMHVYLPIAEMSVNVVLFLAWAGRWGFFGAVRRWRRVSDDAAADLYRRAVGGAVGTGTAQIVASSVSGAIAQYRATTSTSRWARSLLGGHHRDSHRR